jgi:hypothetical protein
MHKALCLITKNKKEEKGHCQTPAPRQLGKMGTTRWAKQYTEEGGGKSLTEL